MALRICGIWEEIQERGTELGGHVVEVKALNNTGSNKNPDQVPLSIDLEGLVGTVNFSAPDLSDNTGEAFTALLLEKPQSEQSCP